MASNEILSANYTLTKKKLSHVLNKRMRVWPKKKSLIQRQRQHYFSSHLGSSNCRCAKHTEVSRNHWSNVHYRDTGMHSICTLFLKITLSALFCCCCCYCRLRRRKFIVYLQTDTIVVNNGTTFCSSRSTGCQFRRCKTTQTRESVRNNTASQGCTNNSYLFLFRHGRGVLNSNQSQELVSTMKW